MEITISINRKIEVRKGNERDYSVIDISQVEKLRYNYGDGKKVLDEMNEIIQGFEKNANALHDKYNKLDQVR